MFKIYFKLITGIEFLDSGILKIEDIAKNLEQSDIKSTQSYIKESSKITLEEFESFFSSYKQLIKDFISNMEEFNVLEWSDKQKIEKFYKTNELVDKFRTAFESKYLKAIYEHDIANTFGTLTPSFVNLEIKIMMGENLDNETIDNLNYFIYALEYTLEYLGEEVKKEIGIVNLFNDLYKNRGEKKLGNIDPKNRAKLDKEYINLNFNLSIIGNTDKKIFGNPGDLFYLFDNFIKNAVIHGHADSMEIKYTETDNNMLKIEVMDNGIGINGYKNIYDIFKAGVTDGKGDGIGITNADTRIKNIGGTIEIHNYKGLDNSNNPILKDSKNLKSKNGTKFVLYIPLQEK